MRRGGPLEPLLAIEFVAARLRRLAWLTTRHTLIAAEVLFRSTIDSSLVYVREVVKRALEVNAAAVILFHNHPSGDPTPSAADKAITEKLRDGLRLISVRLLDHLVVTNTRPVSLAVIHDARDATEPQEHIDSATAAHEAVIEASNGRPPRRVPNETLRSREHAATEAEGQAAHVSIAAPLASAIFGSLAIAYARTRGTPYGPIRFNAPMGRFVLAKTLVPPPDSVLHASFRRKALPILTSEHGYGGPGRPGIEVASPEPMGFDKPSNGLFLPAEFSSLNCFYCFAWIESGGSVYLKVGGTNSGTPTFPVGQWIGIESAVSGSSPQCVTDTPGQSSAWFHLFYATDGWSTDIYTSGSSIAGAYASHASAPPCASLRSAGPAATDSALRS